METCLFSAGSYRVELGEDTQNLFLKCDTFIQLKPSSLVDTQDFLKAKHSMFYFKKAELYDAVRSLYLLLAVNIADLQVNNHYNI